MKHSKAIHWLRLSRSLVGGFLRSRFNTAPTGGFRNLRAWVALALLLPAPMASAFCGFYVAQADSKLYNQASQVVIAREDDSTVLTMSNDFQGEVKDFAVVIPVPTVIGKEQVRVVERKFIEHLDAYSAPRLVEYPPGCGLHGDTAGLGAALSAVPTAQGVRVEAAYTVGEYDIVLLSAEESGGLLAWLKQNGYRLPEGAEPVIGSYLKQDLRFFVARVNLGEHARLGYQYLRPLQIRYETRKFMLPIRLGTVNAQGPQDLVVYTLTRKGRVETTNYRTLPVPTGVEVPPLIKSDFGGFYKALFDREVEKEGRQAVFTEYFWNLSWKCDPCSAGDIPPEELKELGIAPQSGAVFLTRLHVRYDREHFPEDLILTETGDTQNYQARYVIPAWVSDQPASWNGPLQPLYRQLSELTGWSPEKLAAMLPKAPAETTAGREPPIYDEPPVAPNTLPRERRQWSTWGGDPAGTRYSPLNLIHRGNAGRLQALWQFSTGALRGHEGGPLVVDDMIYIHTGYPHKVYALSQAGRAKVWEYPYRYQPGIDQTQVIGAMCCDVVNRGLAYADGRLFLAQGDASLIALDVKSGAAVWRIGADPAMGRPYPGVAAPVGDPKKGETSTNAPLIVKDKVITGISGGEFGVRGFIAAYYSKDGSLAWKAYSTGPDAEMKVDPEKTRTWTDGKMQPVGKDSSLGTWRGEQWKTGGGAAWGWYSYDPELNLIYYGSGSPGPWNPVQRPGDNRWTASLWARDADTGEARWVYQMTPHDEWDYDATAESLLIDRPFTDQAGKVHDKLLVHLDKNGFGYTLDRATGELLKIGKFDLAVNWAQGVDLRSGRPQRDPRYSPQAGGEDHETKGICPASVGARGQGPAAWSPRTGLVYVPGFHRCMDLEPFAVEYAAGQPYVGATHTFRPAGVDALTGMAESDSNAGSFVAWDPLAGRIAWQVDERLGLSGGMLATAGDLVAYGSLEGDFKLRDARTGAEIYTFRTPSGIVGNVSTWEYQGRQYFGVLSGLGGWAQFTGCGKPSPLGGVFTVFGLPEKDPGRS